MVPTWTLAAAAIVGVAAGFLVGRLTSRQTPSEATGLLAAPTAAAEVEQQPATTLEVPAAEAQGAESAEVPRIDMEDVVSELERRYQGKRADEEKERARRKAEREPPAAG